jgi:hypothetical protein
MIRRLLLTCTFSSILSVLLLMTLSVSNATEFEDIVPPKVVDMWFEPHTINTSEVAQIITVSLHITDNLAGFKEVYLEGLSTRASNQMYTLTLTESHRISGTSLDGIYQTTFTLPQYSAQGLWIIRWMQVDDHLDNRSYYSDPPVQCHYCYPSQFGFWNGVSRVHLPFLSFFSPSRLN